MCAVKQLKGLIFVEKNIAPSRGRGNLAVEQSGLPQDQENRYTENSSNQTTEAEDQAHPDRPLKYQGGHSPRLVTILFIVLCVRCPLTFCLQINYM